MKTRNYLQKLDHISLESKLAVESAAKLAISGEGYETELDMMYALSGIQNHELPLLFKRITGLKPSQLYLRQTA